MTLYFVVARMIMTDMHDSGVGSKRMPGLKMGSDTYISLKWVKVKIAKMVKKQCRREPKMCLNFGT